MAAADDLEKLRKDDAANIRDYQVETHHLRDGSITTAKLASGITTPPSGPAGGDLAGTYPNPTVKQASGAFAFTGIVVPAQITADQNDYNPASLSTAGILQLNGSAVWNITGLQGGAAGRLILLRNEGAFNLQLAHLSASSLAANRFSLPLAANYVIEPGQGVELVYLDNRWKLAAHKSSLATATPAAVAVAGTTGGAEKAAREDHAHPHEAAHVAHDTLYDAKGDLPVGTGADTAAKLVVGANGTIVQADSTQATGLKYSSPLCLKSIQKFTPSVAGTTDAADRTYTTPANIFAIMVLAIGGGGAGGGCPVNTGCAGGGGASGSWAEKLYTSPAATFKFRVGARGAGVSGAAGGNGGTTDWKDAASVALFSTPGGGGGNAGVVQPSVSAGGTAGGVPTGTFDMGTDGDEGVMGVGLAATAAGGGKGGSTPWGGGGKGARVASAGNSNVGTAGKGAGGGGGGNANTGTGAVSTGPNGADGAIYVLEYGI
jgi:hypothetical protein